MGKTKYKAVEDVDSEEPISSSKARRLSYWPNVLSIPWLLVVLLCTLVLIAGLEYAARTLPTHPRQHLINPPGYTKQLYQRDDLVSSDVSANTTVPPAVTSSTLPLPPTPPTTSPSPESPLSTPENIWVEVVETISGSVITYSESKPSTAYVPLELPLSEVLLPSPVQHSNTTDRYVPLVITSTLPSPLPSTQSNLKPITLMPVGSAGIGAYDTVASGVDKVITTTNALGYPTTMTTRIVPVVPTNVVPLDSEHFSQVRVKIGITTYTVGSAVITEYSTADIPFSVLNTASATVIGILVDGPSNVATDTAVIDAFLDSSESVGQNDISPTINYAVADDGQIVTLSAAPTAVSLDGIETGDSATFSGASAVLTFPVWKIFVGTYLPVLLAVMLKLFWTAIHVNAKIMQPFINMARPEGAPIQQAFFTDYLSTSLNPIQMAKGQRWLVLCTMLNLGLVTMLVPLSSEAIYLNTNYDCTNRNEVKDNPCWPPIISADSYVIKAIQALLSVVAVISLFALVVAACSERSVPKDPSSIGTIASLMHHPDLLRDFRVMKLGSDFPPLQTQLRNARYSLQNYNVEGRQRYGIVPITEEEEAIEESESGPSSPEPTNLQQMFQNHADLLLQISTLILAIGFLGLLIAYFMDRSTSSFNNFFNSNGFGPRFVMTTLASLVAKGVITLCQDMTLKAPFHRLNSHPSTASSTLWLRKSSLPLISIGIFAYHGYVFPALFCFVAALADLLIIFSAIIPYSPGHIWLEYLVSIYTCIAIMSLIILAIILLIFWGRRLRMPRRPDTLAGVMSYLYASRLLSDMRGAESDEREHSKDLNGSNGNLYVYGRREDEDGVTRWIIDSDR